MPVSAKLTSDQDQSNKAAAATRNTAKSEHVVDDDFHNVEPGRMKNFSQKYFRFPACKGSLQLPYAKFKFD